MQRTVIYSIVLVWGSLLQAGDLPWQAIAPHFSPPAEFQNDLGDYRSPLLHYDGRRVTTAQAWPARRAEILAHWLELLGGWPRQIESPRVERLDVVEHDGYREEHVILQVGEGLRSEGYLLLPPGKGPFPAVVVPFYEPQTSVGRGKPDTRGAIDFGYELTRRGFVTLSIGTPGAPDHPGLETRELLIQAGNAQRRQPLVILASAASHARRALAAFPQVQADRIGIVGHSYGGKWSMFASCLDDQFAAAVWCDPGIVWDETNSNVNYWEPWYLGWEEGVLRPRGIPSADRPRTGLYKRLYEGKELDLVDFHALMAPRPVLDSGGSEDPPHRWRALNHLIAVNTLLGQRERVGMTNRMGHRPTPEAVAVIYAFFHHTLQAKP